ncbi:hypothetical protein ANCCAN_29238 [Ancylostoma caninum]|uniref:Uncharacterized protein n=1 Tax=Ancylostoma caninum TaxID=29170 RepID=A0A368EYZ5_ANCCA|nr:hypothetical protein ANCCAN_29238 [Ancylostoma caninum]
MCLSTSIISFGAFFVLLVRLVNHISFLATGDDIIPLTLLFFLIRLGALVATCGNPWVLIALFPTVRDEAFPCCRRKPTRTTAAFVQ